MDTRIILANNINALMERHEKWKKPRDLAPVCFIGKRKVGWRTIQRVVSPPLDSDWSPQLWTIQAIANAFGVDCWMLLCPAFDPTTKNPAPMPSKRAMDLALRVEKRNLNDGEVELLLKLLGDGVPDEQLEHLRAPAMAEPRKDKEYARAAKRRR